MENWKANWYKEMYEWELKDSVWAFNILEGCMDVQKNLMEKNTELREENKRLRRQLHELQESEL